MDLKLTDANGCTRGDTLWTPGEWRETSGKGELCGPGWLHYYHNATPELAAALDPIHAGIGRGRRLWRVEAGGKQLHEPLKSGASRMRVVEEVDGVTPPSVAALCRWAIAVARAIPSRTPIDEWEAWADAWLGGTRSAESAEAEAAEAAAAEAAGAAAAWAAARAARAAWAVAWAAESAAARRLEELARQADEIREVIPEWPEDES